MRTYISAGIVSKTKTPFKGAFDVEKFIKDTLIKFSIPVVDPCCAAGNEALTTTPVIFNEETQSIQRYNPTTGEFVDADVSVDHTPVAINVTATATAAQLAAGVITSTSAAAVALTLPNATDLGTELGAARGTIFDFAVDNISGANTVTVTVNTGIVAITAVITGGATLTVAAGTVGLFKIYFSSATAAKLARVA